MNKYLVAMALAVGVCLVGLGMPQRVMAQYNCPSVTCQNDNGFDTCTSSGGSCNGTPMCKCTVPNEVLACSFNWPKGPCWDDYNYNWGCMGNETSVCLYDPPTSGPTNTPGPTNPPPPPVPPTAPPGAYNPVGWIG